MATEFKLTENLRFLLPLIYIIPTYFLYLFLLFTVFLSRMKQKFSGSFCKLFGAASIYYFIYSIIYYLNVRVTTAPIIIPFVKSWGVRGFLPTFLQTASFYLLNCTHLFSASLSLNRFTVFALRASYQPFWDRYLKYIIGFCVLYPLGLVWHIPFTDVYLQLANESDPTGRSYIAECHPETFEWMNNARNTAILITFTASSSLVMNVYVITRMLEQRFCYGNRQQILARVSPQDIKMSIFTMLIFATEVVNCVQHVTVCLLKHVPIRVNPPSRFHPRSPWGDFPARVFSPSANLQNC